VILKSENLCGGKACIDVEWQGSHRKVTVEQIMRLKSGLHSNGDLIRMFPGLHKKQIQEAVRYAKEHPEEIRI
jgi:uncharacterized protein (DUF433 family)